MAAAEDRLWWYRGLRRLVVSNLERFLPKRPSPLIVDIGCGTGGTFQAVRAAFPGIRYVGLDPEPKALEYCRARGLRARVRASANGVPFSAGTAEAVLCLDVLYYAGVNRPAALARFFEVLKPGGLLVLNLPAFEGLRGQHDLAVGIAKRFRASEVRALCEGAGFQVLIVTYWNATLLLPLLIWRWLSRAAGASLVRSDTGRSPRVLNSLLSAVVLIEVWLARWVRYPVGSSVFVVARRPAA